MSDKAKRLAGDPSSPLVACPVSHGVQPASTSPAPRKQASGLPAWAKDKWNRPIHTPIPRYTKSKHLGTRPLYANILKPHIYYDNYLHKWVCGNNFSWHSASSPTYAYRGFVRKVISKWKGYPERFRDKS